VLTRVIAVDDASRERSVLGRVREREVTYWIGRSYWGKGIATDALTAFLAVDRSRPLHARVASDNVASRRVLEKCRSCCARTGSAATTPTCAAEPVVLQS
jgi:RimJ/RimL family protein N-acetyltransferase